MNPNGLSRRPYGRMVALALLLVLAAFLRFSHLSERGLLEVDEGFYTQGARSYVALGSYVVERLQGSLNEGLASYFEAHGGVTHLSEKPTFLILGYVAALVLGFQDYTLLYLSAFFGTLTVGLIYLVGCTVFKRRDTALLSAFFVAISPLHIAFSRSAYPNVTATALTWLAVLVYLKALDASPRSGARWRLASGALVGLAYTVHSGFFWLPLILFCSEGIRLAGRVRQESFGRAAAAMGRLAVATALPLLLWEAVFQVGRWVLGTNPAWAAALQRPTGEAVFYTYFESLMLWFRSDALVLSSAFLEPFYYVKLLYTHEAWFVFILAVLGLVVIAANAYRAGTAGWAWVVALFLIPLGTFSFMDFGGPRHMVVVVPAMCLLAARGAVWLIDFVAPDGLRVQMLHLGVKTAIAALVLALQVGCIQEILAIRGNYQAAIDFMNRNGGVKHLSDRMYVGRVYVGRSNAIDHFFSLRASDADMGRHQISLEKLKQVYADGYRYLVRHSRQPAVVPPYDNELVTITESGQVQPEFTVSQPVGWYWPASICRSDRDAGIPQELQVFSIETVIQNLEREMTG